MLLQLPRWHGSGRIKSLAEEHGILRVAFADCCKVFFVPYLFKSLLNFENFASFVNLVNFAKFY